MKIGRIDEGVKVKMIREASYQVFSPKEPFVALRLKPGTKVVLKLRLLPVKSLRPENISWVRSSPTN